MFNYPKILLKNIAQRDDASIVNFQQKIIRVLKEYFKKTSNQPKYLV